jgi:hypothetical protein
MDMAATAPTTPEVQPSRKDRVLEVRDDIRQQRFYGSTGDTQFMFSALDRICAILVEIEEEKEAV